MAGETERFLTGLQRAIANAYLDPLFELGKFMFESGRLTRKLNVTFASKKTCYWYLNCSKVSYTESCSSSFSTFLQENFLNARIFCAHSRTVKRKSLQQRNVARCETLRTGTEGRGYLHGPCGFRASPTRIFRYLYQYDIKPQ